VRRNDNNDVRKRRTQVLGQRRAELLAHLHLYVAALERRVAAGACGSAVVLRVAESAITDRLLALDRAEALDHLARRVADSIIAQVQRRRVELVPLLTAPHADMLFVEEGIDSELRDALAVRVQRRQVGEPSTADFSTAYDTTMGLVCAWLATQKRDTK
jgi:hypothetical protein